MIRKLIKPNQTPNTHMKQAKKFELSEVARQVVVFADYVNKADLPLLESLAKKKGIDLECLEGPTHQFTGRNGRYYAPFQTRIAVEVSPQLQATGEKQRQDVNNLVNLILGCTSSRCVVYNANGRELYSRQ